MLIVKLGKHSRFQLSVLWVSEWIGLLIACAIAITWLLSLIVLLPSYSTIDSPVNLMFWMLIRTFLHTGLFVVAHDAIHRNVLPKYPVTNHCIGQLALGLYGFLPYKICRKLHWQHHTHPAQPQDPDFYPKVSDHWIGYFIKWYWNFMGNYLPPRNLAWVLTGISLSTVALVSVIHIAIQNILLFWIVPWILSSLQLFTFGIFLPHHIKSNSETSHQPRSYYYPVIWSLLTCYHFGYHWEHHTYPDIPWYRLPDIAMLGRTPRQSLLN